MNRFRRSIHLLLLVSSVATLQACIAAVPAVSAISAGAAAGEKGYSFWRSGRLYYVDEGSVEDMTQAVDRMVNRLGLTVGDRRDVLKAGQLGERQWVIRTDHGHLLRLEIHPLTRSLVGVELDTGAFGNNAAAQLVAQRIKEELQSVRDRNAADITIK